MRRLIVDAGSTKTEWVVMEDNRIVDRLVLGGYNPNYSADNALTDMLRQAWASVTPEIDAIHYYGSGCGLEANKMLVSKQLTKCFPKAMIEVETDMIGAARALFGQQKGIACILGTGVNSCLYDGSAIVDHAVSLGYLVGDEGSGCDIGKRVVRAYFYNLMPLELKLSFEHDYKLNINDFIQHVYHEKEASKYLAGFAKFAGEHQDDPFIRQLIRERFGEFADAFLLRYEGVRHIPVGIVGSVAYHFHAILKETLEAEGLSSIRVLQSPSEGLVSYYSNR